MQTNEAIKYDDYIEGLNETLSVKNEEAKDKKDNVLHVSFTNKNASEDKNDKLPIQKLNAEDKNDNWPIRQLNAKNTTDIYNLLGFVKDNNIFVVNTAFEKIQNSEFKNDACRIMANSKNVLIQRIAAENSYDKDILSTLIKNSNDFNVFEAAFNRMVELSLKSDAYKNAIFNKNERSQKFVAKNSDYKEIISNLIKNSDDKEFLSTLIKNSDDSNVLKYAFNRMVELGAKDDADIAKSKNRHF